MEGAGKDDDVRPLRIGFGDFDGIFIGFSTAVDEEGALFISFDRCNGIEFFCQGHVAFVSDDVGHGVEVFACLFLDGFDDFRLGVADVQDTDAAYPVEEVVAVDIFEHGAFTALDDGRIDSADGVRDGLTAAG